jgi:hypothetical protein
MKAVGLETPKEFLNHVVDVDMAEFSAAGQAELRLAYHACISLFSLRDWVSRAQHGKAWTYNGTVHPVMEHDKPGVFYRELINIDPAFGVIADIANATKHMVLERGLTSLYGAANVHVVVVSASSDGTTSSPSSSAAPSSMRVAVQIGSDFIDVLDQAKIVHDIWQKLFNENSW